MTPIAVVVQMALVLALGLSGCGTDAKGLTREELLDPETCKDCHPQYFSEWKSSMHAYAAEDPVFLAMNRRGQRETNGELGDFCIQCHAPMALREGATTDGLNIEEVDEKLKGVTCYFCHNVDAVEGTHNNPLRLANDTTMRGGISDPKSNSAHSSEYSALHDLEAQESSSMCGACHDIVTDKLHLERTFAEWKESIFSDETLGQSCSSCHMRGSDAPIADVEGVPLRRRHSHSFPGVDIAITEWPGIDEQRRLIVEEELRTTVQSKLCYNPATNSMELSLTNVAGGHMFPSGATHDRRAWVQMEVELDSELILQSGVIADDQSIDAVQDPNLWRIHQEGKDGNGEVAHMFWEIETLEGELLAPGVTFDPSDPRFDHSSSRAYPLGANPRPDRAEAVVFIRPLALSLLDDLIESGDLEPKFRDRIESFELTGSRIVWTAEAAGSDLCVP